MRPDETVAEMGCDFLCAGTHKWMFGPRGTGIAWARASEWARLRPSIPSFSSFPAWDAWMAGSPPVRPVTALDHSPGGFKAYEHEWALSAAFQFHRAIGRARVSARIGELNERCKRGLAAIPKVRVITPSGAALSAGIVCFEVAGLGAQQVGEALVARRAARHALTPRFWPSCRGGGPHAAACLTPRSAPGTRRCAPPAPRGRADVRRGARRPARRLPSGVARTDAPPTPPGSASGSTGSRGGRSPG